ncbi:hypothetical protein PB2503_02452 [Parvularcula bermudensis HTCC2503]|uniref:Zinc metalloprotease n=1 Tax=Parvularcula bermudensis (strain ATCC BAA-594 / HTCC2503 / KCTC 12087) TaxID=314260 RepID=E0TCD4_PARBH|nr:RIP metalloprotease RseP [Parvularcula bermudensis]ADM08567.1 hypothetical protein PB2503_02452 [Parvularcula bermudensis HTCC2503]
MVDLALTVLVSLVAFAVLLAFIVFIHEYGHFKTARLCGVKVETFSIGFGKAMLQWTDRKGTVWKIAAIPLGGYVKFFGDANAASAGTEAKGARPATTQFGSEKDRLAALLTEEEKRVCFHFKPVWQRALIVAAGPVANFILGALIFSAILFLLGTRTVDPVVGRVAPNTVADAAGFEPGDRILSVNGRTLRSFNDLVTRVRLAADETLTFVVERDGETETITATPRRTEQTDAYGNKVRMGQLGIVAFTPPLVGALAEEGPAAAAGLAVGDEIVSVAGQEVFTFSDIYDAIEGRAGQTVPVQFRTQDGQIREVRVTLGTRVVGEGATAESYATLGIGAPLPPLRTYSPLMALVDGTRQVGTVIETTLRYLGRLILGREDPRQMGGPVKIAQYAGQAAKSGFEPTYDIPLSDRLKISLSQFISLAGLISVSIGFMNLLPIPVLDGGHLVYYGYEAIAGRPLSDRVQGIGFRVGLAIVGTFMIFVIVNDVVGLVMKVGA